MSGLAFSGRFSPHANGPSPAQHNNGLGVAFRSREIISQIAGPVQGPKPARTARPNPRSRGCMVGTDPRTMPREEQVHPREQLSGHEPPGGFFVKQSWFTSLTTDTYMHGHDASLFAQMPHACRSHIFGYRLEGAVCEREQAPPAA